MVAGAAYCMLFAYLVHWGFSLRLHPMAGHLRPVLIGLLAAAVTYVALALLVRGTSWFAAALAVISVPVYMLLLPGPDNWRELDVTFEKAGRDAAEARPYKKMSLNSESRRCRAIEFGRALSLRIPYKEGHRLHFGLGLPRMPHAKDGFNLEVSLAGRRGSARTIMSKNYGLDKSRWQDVFIDLEHGLEKGGLMRVRGSFADPRDMDRVPARYSFFLTSPRLVVSGAGPGNVVFILVDTLRADKLGSYGGAEGSSPAFDRLAEKGVLFTRAFSQSSWTPPSVAAILTGRLPHQLGLKPHNYLPEGAFTLAERFAREGWLTASVSSNRIISPESNFDQGFDTFMFHPRTMVSYFWDSAEWVTNSATTWFSRHPGVPKFLYLHYSDPHIPYLAPLGHAVVAESMSASDFVKLPLAVASLGAYLNAPLLGRYKQALSMRASYRDAYLGLYNGEVNYWDLWLGRLLSGLEQSGELDRTTIVITSDHGEEFLEHGFYLHGYTLYNEVIHVPLLIVASRLGEGEKVEQVVQTVDIFPTLENLFGWEHAPRVFGRSLTALFESDGTWDDLAFSHVHPITEFEAIALPRPGHLDDPPLDCFALIRGDWKLIQLSNGREGKKELELFNIDKDFQERVDLAGGLPGKLEEMKRAMEDLQEGLPEPIPPVKRKPSPELIKMLKSLGYLNK